jgi:hypothetical protein
MIPINFNTQERNVKLSSKNCNQLFHYTLIFGRMAAQNNDSIKTDEVKKDSAIVLNTKENALNYKKLIIPTALIGYGVASLSVKNLKKLNFSTRR